MKKELPLSRSQLEIIAFIKQNRLKKEAKMNNFVLSLVRTYVPIIVGAFVAWLLTLGIELDVQAQTGLVVFLTGVVQAVYYTVVRLLEKNYPQIGLLLGASKAPEYTVTDKDVK